MHLLPSLVADIEFSIHDDLHFMVRVCVDEWSAGFESVESTADRLLLVDVITIKPSARAQMLAPQLWLSKWGEAQIRDGPAVDVTKVCVFVGDERGLEC